MKKYSLIATYFERLKNKRKAKYEKNQFYFFLFLCLVAIIFFFNYVGIGYLIYLFVPSSATGNLKGVWEIRNRSEEIVKEQRRINLALKVVDQFGEAAVDYRVAVIFIYVGWYHGILPDVAFYKQARYVVKTDKNGEVNLHPFFPRRATDIYFEEIDKERYALRAVGSLKFNNICKDSKGGTALKWIDPEGKGQNIELRVLRHGPAANLKVYKPKMKRGKDGKIESIEAKDENVFTLDIENNEIKEGEGEGDIILRIKNLKRVCNTYKEREKIRGGTSVDFDEKAEWSLTISGLDNVLIRQKDIETPTYAPLIDYKKELTYHFAHCYLFSSAAAEKLKKEGWGSIANPEVDLSPNVTSLEKEEYRVVVGNQVERSFYLKGIEEKCYGILKVKMFIDLPKGEFQIQAEGYYNPDGTNNLWKEVY